MALKQEGLAARRDAILAVLAAHSVACGEVRQRFNGSVMDPQAAFFARSEAYQALELVRDSKLAEIDANMLQAFEGQEDTPSSDIRHSTMGHLGRALFS
jgi:hypothetical protein